MKPIAPLDVRPVAGFAVSLDVPTVAFADVEAVLARSAQAREAHQTICGCAKGGQQLDGRAVEAMLERAGVERSDVKVVLAHHARVTPQAFTEDGIRFLNKLDWSDIGSAYINELRQQNATSEANFETFIREDSSRFLEQDGDRKRVVAGLQEKAHQQALMRSDSAFDTAAQIEGQAAQANVRLSPVEATVLTLRARALRSQT